MNSFLRLHKGMNILYRYSGLDKAHIVHASEYKAVLSVPMKNHTDAKDTIKLKELGWKLDESNGFIWLFEGAQNGEN